MSLTFSKPEAVNIARSWLNCTYTPGIRGKTLMYVDVLGKGLAVIALMLP